MDQLLRRTRMAERQVARRAKARSEMDKRRWKRERVRDASELLREVGRLRSKARQTRRQDWEMGPLAPRRDVPMALGFQLELGGYEPMPWGAISANRARMNLKVANWERDARCAWAGGSTHLCLRPGDRVVCLEGPYKGQISTVAAIYLEQATLEVHDFTANVVLPNYAFDPSSGASRVNALPARLPISAVRLVYPMKRDDGTVRDVVVRQLRAVSKAYDRLSETVTWQRMVPGPNVILPWPKEDEPKRADQPGDTTRVDAETRTFVPTLLSPPMPPAVLDELRGRYSKFRTRHDDEYVARKAAEYEAARKGKAAPEAMRTPLQEFHIKEKEARRARGQPVLSDEMLAKIGMLVAKNRKKTFGGVFSGEGGRASVSENGGVGEVEAALKQLTVEEPVPEGGAPGKRPPLS